MKRLEQAYKEENEAVAKAQKKSLKPNFPKIKK